MTLDETTDMADLAALAEAAPEGPSLATPRITVTMDDGRLLTTQVRNADYLRWDRTAAKHGWPTMAKAPFTWLTFVAWSALRREGQIADAMTWEAFSETHCLQVVNATSERANGSAAGPTLPGPEPG